MTITDCAQWITSSALFGVFLWITILGVRGACSALRVSADTETSDN